MNPTELALLNNFQRDFPLCPTPFAAIARQLGTTEEEVLESVRGFAASGIVSRVGPVFRPHSIGVSTLAALAVPEDSLEVAAALVNRFPQVNHNYEREHPFNLWFVVTALDNQQLDAALSAIGTQTACRLMSLPLLEAYYLDLGFDLRHGYRAYSNHSVLRKNALPIKLDGSEYRLIAALQGGLPLVPRPYQSIAQQTGFSEARIFATIECWLATGIVTRFGIIVRHRELGFSANAMTVWDVPDELIRDYGRLLSAQGGVNLCYHRPRHLPDWPYNLFGMLHGHSREEVLTRIAAINSVCGLARFPQAVLFSRRCFKQRGARYVPVEEAA